MSAYRLPDALERPNLNLMQETKSVIFDGDLTAANIGEFIDALEKIEGDIVVYFSSLGGSVVYGDLLLDYLNRNDERVELVVAGVVASSAFDVVVKFTGEKRLLDWSYALVHLATRDVDLIAHKSGDYETKFLVQQVDRKNNEYLCFLKEVVKLSKKELKRVRRFKDLLLTRERLEEILKL